jgi:uncharacterized protein (TIGR03032 family)
MAPRRKEPARGHDAAWRDPGAVVAAWAGASPADASLLRHEARGAFWDVLAELGITLLVTREYEHLVMAFQVEGGRPRVTYLRVPHPSGLAVDRLRGAVHLASTRNPNQIHELLPIAEHAAAPASPCLMPMRSRFLPGRAYLHDLAFIGGALHANAVGENAVIRFEDGGAYDRVWWPRCVAPHGAPLFDRNYIQLNSIAAGADLDGSYFSASADVVSRRRPGHLDFRVDRAGVVFSGRSREPVVRGLTRPHSARLHEGQLWVCNSGYGEVGVGDDGRFSPVARLPGWTRGLCFAGDVAFVGTSRVLPRFRAYAPGLDADASSCAVHALDARTGEARGLLRFPSGDQIFAIDWLPSGVAAGLPFSTRRAAGRERALFYSFPDPLSGAEPR